MDKTSPAITPRQTCIRKLPDGSVLEAEVSPCVFMYSDYPLQLTVTLRLRAWAGHVDGQILKVYRHIADCESKAQMARLFPMSESASSDQPVEGQGTEGGDSQPKE